MAALTNTTGINEFIVETSTDDGSTWTDQSDFVQVASPDAWSRAFGDARTHGTDESYQKAGKLLPTTITLNYLYTDGETTDFVDTLETQHVTADGGQLMVRVSYAGTSSGKRYYATNTDAKIMDFTLPTSDADSPGPHAASVSVRTSGWDSGTHT